MISNIRSMAGPFGTSTGNSGCGAAGRPCAQISVSMASQNTDTAADTLMEDLSPRSTLVQMLASLQTIVPQWGGMVRSGAGPTYAR